jgi:hypothetical protein
MRSLTPGFYRTKYLIRLPPPPRDAPGIAYSLLAREAPLESGSVDEAIATGYPCRR